MRKLLSILLLIVAFTAVGQRSNSNYYIMASGGTESFDVDYQAVLDYATLQGYTLPSADQQILQNALVVALKSSGAWAKLDVIYIFATDAGLDFARINWKDPSSYYGTLTGTVIHHSNQGVQATTLSGRIETGYQPSVHLGNFVLDDASFGVWLYTAGTLGNYVCCDFARNLLRTNGSTTRLQSAVSTAVAAPVVGFNSLERDNSTQFKVYANGSLVSTYSAGSSSVDDNPFVLLNRHGQNVATDAIVSFFYAGSYIGDNDVYSVISTYMSAL